ncbi:hypothetical protein B0H13DRAFT_2648903 [Mycena leptocephala]|nr:hypothetical protein B0H13DRAFT_2648903 [Mycena leptocephala]
MAVQVAVFPNLTPTSANHNLQGAIILARSAVTISCSFPALLLRCPRLALNSSVESEINALVAALRVPTSVLAFALHPTFITALSTPDVGYVDARRVAFRLSCLWTVPSLPTGPPHPVVPNFPPLASKFWPPIVQMGLLERSLSVHFKTRDNRSTETHASGFSAYQKAMGRRPILLPHLFPHHRLHVNLPAVPPEGVSNLLCTRPQTPSMDVPVVPEPALKVALLLSQLPHLRWCAARNDDPKRPYSRYDTLHCAPSNRRLPLAPVPPSAHQRDCLAARECPCVHGTIFGPWTQAQGLCGGGGLDGVR